MQASQPTTSLRLLSFNIQAGTSTTRYRHYLTRGWRQVLPHSNRIENLDAVAELMVDYDVVGLQEVDSGSLRAGYVNQTKYLANHAGFGYWSHQLNRKVGRIAYGGNGLLTRFEPSEITDHRLPGAIPGRGALWARYGNGDRSLHVVVLHLALGRRAREAQLDYVAERLGNVRHCIIMGDLNTSTESAELRRFVRRGDFQTPTADLLTYPSWQPQRAIDHILISPGLEISNKAVLAVNCSDHCPVSVTVKLPATLPPRVEQQAAVGRAQTVLQNK